MRRFCLVECKRKWKKKRRTQSKLRQRCRPKSVCVFFFFYFFLNIIHHLTEIVYDRMNRFTCVSVCAMCVDEKVA